MIFAFSIFIVAYLLVNITISYMGQDQRELYIVGTTKIGTFVAC